jgi:hypothetical protein
MDPRTQLIAAALVAAPTLAAAALAEPAGIAPGLRAAANEQAAFVLSGSGVYVYQCKQNPADANRYGWYFVAPDATLYEGSREAARFATPTLFESLSDRTSVATLARATQPAGSGNLPWAMMRAQPLGASAGMFNGITSVQRVNTRGGLPPAGGCDADNIGEEARVAFNADYYFYRQRGTS